MPFTISSQILQHFSLEQHLTNFRTKVTMVKFGSNLNTTAPKNLRQKIERHCTICVDTVCRSAALTVLGKEKSVASYSLLLCVSGNWPDYCRCGNVREFYVLFLVLPHKCRLKSCSWITYVTCIKYILHKYYWLLYTPDKLYSTLHNNGIIMQTRCTLLFHSNLNITNKSVKPFLFTISNNSPYKM